MSNIIKAEVTVEGIRPILWHHFGPDAIPLEKQEKTGVAGNDPEEWKRTVLFTKDGQLYVPGSYIFGTLRDGSKFTKKGKGSIQAALTSTLQVLDDRVLLDRWIPGFSGGLPESLPTDSGELVYLDIRSVVNPSTRGRNVRYRVAASPGWTTAFRLEWDKTIVSRGEMEAACIDAGKLCGLGSGRKIGLGRFGLVSFEIEG
ncbi:MAG: hypothetical protein KJ077_08315 [Anaerolineae bacterium]|nr:hypothetical protein [Anaerolineae bacterium]